MIQYVKRGLWVLLCLFMTGKLAAQEDQRHFIYIQSERSQPFYVKYKGKLLSSSERGYIILPELPAGTSSIAIGFAKNGGPEQQFQLRLGKNDQGFLLKQGEDNAYALYNLQTFSLIKAGAKQNALAENEVAQPEPAAADTGAKEAGADTSSKEMMASLQKDIEAKFGDKATIGATDKPQKKNDNNQFADALDKVVSDDRPVDLPREEAAGAAAAGTAPAAGAAAGVALEEIPRKSRKKRNKDRAPLTEEEQTLLSQVMAEEQKAAASDSALETAGGDTAVTETASEEMPKKNKRARKKKTSDPEFIEFGNDSVQQQTSPVEPVVEAVPSREEPAVEATTDNIEGAVPDTASTRLSKRKKRKLAEVIDMPEQPNNILKDSVDYTIPDRREARREKRKQKREEREAELNVDAAVPAGADVPAVAGAVEGAAGAVAEEGSEKKKAATRMVNSDCEDIMDDATFRKMLRRFVGAKDNDGMVETFRRQTRNYCVETSQVRTLVQLVTGDEYRYKLLDMAYSKTADSEKFSTLSNLLTDSYYQGRFKAMLHK